MIIGAADEHSIGIKTAQHMGLKVFSTDRNPTSPGFKIADDHVVACTYDENWSLNAAKEYIAKGGRIDGVMTLASDVPFTVAYVAEKLGLPGIGTESATLASEKVLMKERFQKHGVPMPLFQETKMLDELSAFAAKHGLPVVVKPVDSRGARGVQLVRRQEELANAYAIAKKYSPEGRVMVEQYLPGPQLSTEGFMVDGEVFIPSIFDRNYEFLDRFAPYIVEDGGEMPSRFTEQFRKEIHDVMAAAALALGIKTGIIKGDLVIHDGKVKVIELAARMSGGFFGTVAAPASCGVNLIEANVRLAIGERLKREDLLAKWQRGAAIRFAFPPEGIIHSITGWERVQSDPACKFAHIFTKPGESIAPITNHPSRPAVVVADGADTPEAIHNAKRLMNQLKWEVNHV
jgi:biotin carboxylase